MLQHVPHEPCPFCAKPIIREYGSFRCKHCARSSEDLLDMERKSRAAAARKAARASMTAGRKPAAALSAADAARLSPQEKMRAVALAVARHAARKKQQAAVEND